MIEVELRAKVANLEALEQKVKALGGKYAYSMTNVDEYYLSATDAAACVFGNKENRTAGTPTALKPTGLVSPQFEGLPDPLPQKYDLRYNKEKCAMPENGVVRIRTLSREGRQGKTVLLTIKTIANGDFSVRKELQIGVSDARETQRILEYFGCKKILSLTKHRKIYNVGVVGVLLDDVKELGSWVEVSIEGAKVDAEGARGKLLELLGKMGFEKGEIETKGYFNLAVEKLK